MRKLVFLLVLLGMACGDKQPEAEQAVMPDTAGSLHLPEAGPRIQTTISDSSIINSQDSVQMPGVDPITFVVRNEGTATHYFKIDGEKLGEWSAPVPPGNTVMMSMVLGRGSYQMLWPEDGTGAKRTFKVY